MRWVQILTIWDRLFNRQLPSTDSIKLFESTLQWGTGLKLNPEYLELENIELTFQALYYLYGKFSLSQDYYQKLYKKSHVKDLFSFDWISPTTNAINIIDVFKLLPVLHYCKRCIKNKVSIDDLKLYRITRTIRTLSNDKIIRKAVLNQVANILFFADRIQLDADLIEIRTRTDVSKTILNEELITKFSLYANAKDRTLLEDIIWFAEDLKHNNGEVLHLINTAKSLQLDKEKFDLDNFEKVVITYDEFMQNQDAITGNVLHTNCYYETYDRIEYYNNWYKQSGILNLLKIRVLNKQQTLSTFLINRQKSFIKNYSSVDEIYKETDSKKQLYIYYILSTNRIVDTYLIWNWDGCYNFGKLRPESAHIIFESGYVFQLFKSNFTFNVYRVLEANQFSIKDVFPKLLSWANS